MKLCCVDEYETPFLTSSAVIIICLSPENFSLSSLLPVRNCRGKSTLLEYKLASMVEVKLPTPLMETPSSVR